MNKRVKRTWVRALRSGKYKQGRKRLNRDGRFCCLGVLYEVTKNSRSKDAPQVTIVKPNWDNAVTYNGSKFALSFSIREWADLSIEQADELINLNDRREASFEEIADWIEANL